MKMLIGLFSLVLSVGAFASTVDKKSFVYDGSQNSVELILRAEKTHTEYVVENRPSTCYRQEVVGYRRICTGGHYGPGPYPYPGPYRGPYPYPGPTHCYSEPIYRSVPYSCTRAVTVSFEVKDYDVEARVLVDVTKVSPEATPGETINVTLRGDELYYEAQGSKKFFIVKKKQDTRQRQNGSVKFLDAVLALELVEAAPVQKVLKVTNIAVKENKLLFKIGPVDESVKLGYSLKVVKTKILGSDTVLFDRDLSANEVQVQTASDSSEAQVSLAGLGVDLKNGKYNLTAKVFPKFDGQLLNADQFSELTASRTLVYKVK